MERPQFILLFRQIIEHPECRKNDAELYGYIYWLTCLKNEKCTASNETLATLVGLDIGTIANSLTRLEKFSFIQRRFEDNNQRKNRLEIIPLLQIGITPHVKGVSHPMLNPFHMGDEQNKSIEKEHLTSETKVSQEEIRIVKEGKDGEPKEERQRQDLSYRKIFELWGKYPLNWKVNRTEIASAKNLLEEHKIPKCKIALAFYEQHCDEEMCPQILKPSDLDRKWKNLQAFRDRK